ncbi:hypothetical protein ACFLWB_00855 [Chloroflexota bacterium]
MDGEAFVGHYCSTCGTTVGLAAGAEETLRCPGCGGPMQTAPVESDIRVLMNVSCDNCGSTVGMMCALGSKAVNCPSCGQPFIKRRSQA